jgi:subtilisin family serine protease
MSFPVRGPGWTFVALTTAAVVFVFGLSVSTQGPGRANRITRINGYEAVEGEILVKYRDDRASARHAQIESSADADAVETLDRRGVRRLRSRRLRTAELLALLASDPDVEYAEPNYVLRVDATPNDPSFPSLWGLFNTGFNPVGGGGVAGKDIDAPAAWDITTGSRANVVAIVDTGVDYNHPDLAANMWSAPSAFTVTVGGMTITCQAGTHGFNAITRTCDPMDDQYHGTHVAGTIGAVGDNGVGVTGVNWTASMMAIKFMGSSGSGYTSDAVVGLDFVTQAKARFASTLGANVRVLSNSWGGGTTQSLFNAIDAANSNDILFVAAAGNNASNNDVAPHYPSSYPAPNMVAVASSDNVDGRSSFSNYGATSVHLAAPGSAILSTMPGNSYAILNGTSMATPQVSGAAMLALSMCQVTTAQLKTLLLSSVDQVPAFSGITTTGGRLNVRTMVQNCPFPKVTSLTVTPSAAAPGLLGTTINWTAIATGGQGPYEYRFLLYDGSAWTIARGWSSSNTLAWTPLQANDAYKILAQVRSAWNTGAYDLQTQQAFPIKLPLTSVAIAPSVAAPQRPGTTVTWTATAAGGQTPYQYQWVVWDGTAWTLARGWSAGNTFDWTPSAPNANYRVAAYVRSAWSTSPGELSSTMPFAIRRLVTSLTLTSDLAAPRVAGTTVNFTATAAGGDAPYQYRFLTSDGTSWTVARPWSTTATFAWTPTVASASYKVVAEARSAWNSGTAELSTTRLFPILTPVTLAASLASPRGVHTAISFTATASGWTGPLQYRWILYRFGATIVQDWSTNNVFVWTPSVSSDVYQMKVEIRSGSNAGPAESEATMNYAIKPVVDVATVSSNLSSPQPSGGTIRWQAHAWGGVQPYQYSFCVWDGSAWASCTPWSTSDTFDWMPSTANPNYRIAARVRSAWNTWGTPEITVFQSFLIQ